MKTIARAYDTYAKARQVVANLEAAGCASSDIDLIANRCACEEAVRIGATDGGSDGLLAGLGAVTIPGLGSVIAAGALPSTAAGAAAGAASGGVVGALVRAGVPEAEARGHCEAVRRGGTMVSVRVSETDARHAQRIMEQT